METSEISHHQVKIYTALRDTKEWLTSKDLAKRSGVNERTTRAHLLKFVKLMVVDQVEVFPGHRYRLSDKASKRNQGIIGRLDQAEEIFSGKKNQKQNGAE